MNLPSSEKSILKKLQKTFKTWLLLLLQLAGPQKLHKKTFLRKRRFKRNKVFCFAPTLARSDSPRLTGIVFNLYAADAYCLRL